MRGLSLAGSFVFTVSSNNWVARGSNDSTIHNTPRMNTVPNSASTHNPTPDARPMASVDNITPASFGSSILARYRTSPAAPTMPNARARLEPTTSMTTAPTMAKMIWVCMTAGCRLGVPRLRGRNASPDASAAAIGRRMSAWRS